MSRESRSYTSGGLGVGSILAVFISWTLNHDVGWAILHGWLGWLYVIYCALEGRLP